MSPSKIFAAVAVAMLFSGCPTMQIRYLTQPEQLTPSGIYIHPASRIAFPESIAGFQRNVIQRYDADGLDISAGYNLASPSHRIAATVYVYPAPSVVSFGSPAEVVADARAHLAEGEFERRTQEIQHAHPNATLVSESVHSDGGQSYAGKHAVFDYEETFAGSMIPVRSHLYVFCYIREKWSIEYRFTYPKNEDDAQEIAQFMHDWSW